MALKVTEWDPEIGMETLTGSTWESSAPQFSLVLQLSRSRPLSPNRGVPFAWRQCKVFP